MKAVIRKIIGAIIALIGLTIVGFSIWVIILNNNLWWSWLGIALFGACIAGAGLELTAHGYKNFIEVITTLIPPV